MANAYYFPIATTFPDADLIENLRYRYSNAIPSLYKLPIFKEEEEAEDYGRKCGEKVFAMVQITKTTTKRAVIHVKRDEGRGFRPIIFFADDFIEKCCEVYEQGEFFSQTNLDV